MMKRMYISLVGSRKKFLTFISRPDFNCLAEEKLFTPILTLSGQELLESTTTLLGNKLISIKQHCIQ